MASFNLSPVFVFIACFLISLSLAVKLPANQDQNPAKLEWWKEEIIYQVYPRSHQDTDGDGVGDLKGIQQRLDHFVELGIGAVWISPIYKSPMADFGYDISDFRDIEPQFGTMQDFEDLAKAMRDRGIKLIMDYVPNHSSDEHEWFQKSVKKEGKYTDYYVWKDSNGINGTTGKPIPPNNWNSVFGGSAWEWVDERQQFYLHQFTIKQPDLNFENHDVIVEMLSIIKFWIDKGVDGFRIDAVPHMFESQMFLDEPINPNRGPETLPTDHSYLSHVYTYDLPGGYDVLAQFRRLVDVYTLSDGVERVVLVEATNPTLESLFKWYGTEEEPIAHFPINFEFINRIRAESNGNDIAYLIDEWYCKMPKGNVIPNWLVGNHDNKRVGTRFGADLVDTFNMMMLLLPGNAITYYGEEIGMLNADISWEDTVDPPACAAGPERYEQMSRDPARTPMQWEMNEKNAGFSTASKTWLPMHPDWSRVNVERQKTASGLSHFKVYQQAAKLRHTDIWRYGSMESKAMMGGAMFGFARIYNNVGFVYVANLGNEEVTVDLQDQFEGIPSSAKVYVTSVGFTPNIPAIGESLRTEAVRVGANHSIVLVFPDDYVPPTQPPTEPTTRPTGGPTTTTEDGGGEGETTEGGGGSGGGGSESGSNAIFSSAQNLVTLLISLIVVQLPLRH